MNVFKVNWYKFIQLLSPTFLRKKRVNALLNSAVAPASLLNSQFQRLIEETFFLLKYDTSKRNVEIALRTRFNDAGIYIVNAQPKAGLCLPFYLPDYMENQGYDVPIETAYLPQYLPFYLNATRATPDFIIYVPEATYITSERDIYDFASYFVLPSFRYEVQRY